MEVVALENERVVFLRRWGGDSEVFAVFSFGEAQAVLGLPVPTGRWRKLLDSADERWNGGDTSLPEMLESEGKARLTLSPRAAALFGREGRP